MSGIGRLVGDLLRRGLADREAWTCKRGKSGCGQADTYPDLANWRKSCCCNEGGRSGAGPECLKGVVSPPWVAAMA